MIAKENNLMTEASYVIASSRSWYASLASELQKNIGAQFHLIDDRTNLTLEYLSSINPKTIFFPHWSYIVPDEIFSNYECLIFHMTDVPFGRGGSPLQNLIVRGIKDTKISALRCVKGLDAGDVYLKRDLSLKGTAQEIFKNASTIVKEMIEEIVRTNPAPVPQTGIPIYFKRRTPNESDISEIEDIDKVYDYIRMLDCDGYPKAFVQTQHLTLQFSDAFHTPNGVLAHVLIQKK